MKARTVCFAFAVLVAELCLASRGAADTWINLGPHNVDVSKYPLLIQALAVDPTAPRTIYAATAYHGVYKTTDRGRSWSRINTGLRVPAAEVTTYDHDVSLAALAIDPSAPGTVYLGVKTSLGIFTVNEVYKTADGGENWALTPASPFSSGILAIDPSATETVYAGGCLGVLKTIDGGETWNSAGLPAGNSGVNAVAIDPNGTVYAGANAAVYRTTDGGKNWSGIGYEQDHRYPSVVLSLAIDPTAPEIVYAGSLNALFKTIDGAASWELLRSLTTDQQGQHYVGDVGLLAVDPTTPQTVYAGIWRSYPKKCDVSGFTGGESLYKTTDEGETWGDAGLSGVSALAIDPNGTVYAGVNGVYKRTTDSGGCIGDCDASGVVTVDELVTGVRIALGQSGVETCGRLDTDANGSVGINELVAAVGAALNGCTG